MPGIFSRSFLKPYSNLRKPRAPRERVRSADPARAAENLTLSEFQRNAQAGPRIIENQPRAVQLRDGRHQRQPEPRSRKFAGLIQTHAPAQDDFALIGRDSRPGVLDDDLRTRARSSAAQLEYGRRRA